MIGRLARHREKIKTAVLALVVALSFLLSASLWLETPGGGPPPQPQPYVAGGNLEAAAVPLADVLLPRRVVVHQAGRHSVVADPGRPAFRAAVAAAAEMLSAAARRGAAPVSATAAELAGLRRTGTGVELVLPAEMTAGEWVAAWSGEAAARGLPRSGMSRVPARRIALFAAADGQGALYLEAAQGWVRIPAGDGAILRESIGRMGDGEMGDGEPAAALTGRWRNLKVPDDLYVPAAPGFMRLAAVRELLSPDKLSGSFFPDPGVVRRMDGQDGSILFTDGQQGLGIGADGSVRFDAPQATAHKGGEASPLSTASQAVAFIADHGGWPPGVRLLAVHPAPSDPAAAADPGFARLDFAPGFGGYPLLESRPAASGEAGPDALSAPVSLTVAAPGGVSAYRRAVSLPSGDEAHPGAVSAAQALAALDAAWPGLADGGGQPGLVGDVYPAYMAGPPSDGGDAAFRPVWVVELEGGRRVAVDALTGRVAAGDVSARGER